MRRFWVGVWLACTTLAIATGCKGKGQGPAPDPATMDGQAGLIEERDEGKLEWIVQPEGQVRVKVTLNEGTTPALSGVLLLSGESYSLTPSGPYLTASVPKLTENLTTVAYSLKVGDATWDGTLHVPQGGTKELLTAPSVTVPQGTKGPHGGLVDVIGDQRVEILVDDKTGEVRMYMLDEKLQPIPVGSASAVVGFVQAPDAKPGDAKPSDSAAPQAPKPQETK